MLLYNLNNFVLFNRYFAFVVNIKKKKKVDGESTAGLILLVSTFYYLKEEAIRDGTVARECAKPGVIFCKVASDLVVN